ncbi:MAG: flagellar motor protein MotA [Rhodovibrionaceae bacterium]
MTRPYVYLIRMGIFLGLVAIAAALLFPRLQEAFFANTVLNGMIIGVLLFGIVYIFRQVVVLRAEVNYLDHLRAESEGGIMYPEEDGHRPPPRLLRPMATMLREKKGRMSLSTLSMRTLLDGIQIRIAESHDISRYLIGLLIFLGLLGTFWGLLETVNAVGGTISSLEGGSGDAVTLFEQLRDGLSEPLSGMGTAFSSSLFGLAGSLVLGFLELQAGQAHNRFVNELEEWLSGITRLSGSGSGVSEGEGGVPAYISALLEQTADSLDNLQRTIASGESERLSINRNLTAMLERLNTFTDQMRTEQELMTHLAEGQNQLQQVMRRMAESSGSGMDAATRDHIRGIHTTLSHLSEDTASGRREVIEQLRNEIRILTRTIAALAEETE